MDALPADVGHDQRRHILTDWGALAVDVGDTLVQGLPLFHVHGLVLRLLGSLRVGNRYVQHRQTDARGVCGSRRDIVEVFLTS